MDGISNRDRNKLKDERNRWRENFLLMHLLEQDYFLL